MKKPLIFFTLSLFLFFVFGDVHQTSGQSISTNKDRLLTLAVQGQIAPAQPSTGYITTWDGKPKMAIGTGGINYNLKIGNDVFGWACSERATVGVAAVGVGEGDYANAWLNYTSIGNEVRVINGEAQGEKGIIIGKYGNFILVHFGDNVLEKLSTGNIIQAKACGVGLEINGFNDVFVHSIAPDLLENIGIRNVRGRLEVPVVKEIPAILVGQGHGRSSLSSNWNIQTCYPPDIEEYGLNELRFGDLVLLKDIQTDYGKGYYKGGATVGIVCSGPSDISGLGIGVTAVLSTRSGNITARIDESANIGNYTGIGLNENNSGSYYATDIPGTLPVQRTNVAAFRNNKDKLITIAVEGVVQPPRSSGYRITWDGKPKLSLGTASINYSVSLGDLTSGWANADHVEPDVTIQGRDQASPSDCALAILACIGNEAKVISGEAAGARGIFVGRHAGSDDLVWFPREILEKLALNDVIQVRARGVGLKIEGFEDVRVNKIAPELLENIGITVEDNQLVVPIVQDVPGHIMGSGVGGGFLENVDYDIQTTCPETVEEYNLKSLRLGDLVAITDHYDFYGRGRYEGAVTVGVVIHGWSDSAGHGPGVNPILSAMPGRITLKKDPHANIAYPLGIKPRPRN
ncbi:DUF4438 domain-containing protein [candidate division KSB1 bacterium]